MALCQFKQLNILCRLKEVNKDNMQELKVMHIWICWKYEIKNGKHTKVPKSAAGGATGTTERWRKTWVTYDDAILAKERINADGVGFILPKGYFFLDIDGRSVNDAFAKRLLKRFDTYAESSVSGNGIHIYGKCDLSKIPTYTDKTGNLKLSKDFYQKNSGNGIELYFAGITRRFAAFTGNVISNMPLKDCSAKTLLTLNEDMRRSSKPVDAVYDDAEIFDIICELRKQKNSAKFIKLFDDGDYSDYGSHSEADAALCAMIAFRAGDEASLIDKIFRLSALYREKWERDDYRESTISVGIKACNGTFISSKTEHPYYIKFDKRSNAPYVSAPLLAKYIRENLRYILVRDSGKHSTLKYVYDNGCYRLYSDDMMKGKIKTYISEYNEELVKMNTVNEVLANITAELNCIKQDELNIDEDYINFNNCLLRLSDMTMHPHSPDFLSTIQIPCDWAENPIPTPVFDSYMKTLTNGNNEILQLLLEFMGACISNIKGYKMKKALFLVGDGNTGKSQIKNLTEKLLGSENFIGIDLKEIESRFGTGAIYGTRLAGSSDMSFLSVDELKTFKKITGGDSLFAEFKGMQGFQYTYNGLLWFCMNRLPKFGGDDGQWVYDRIMIVKCPNAVTPDRQDKTLLDKMYAEREGIVYKIVHAVRNVINNGYVFTEPQSVTDAREAYQGENSSVISFFTECMERRFGSKINDSCTTGKVYDVYKAWCGDNTNGYAKSARDFRKNLAEYLGKNVDDLITHTSRGNFYRDYTLSNNTKLQYSRAYGYDDTALLA